jgi:alpha-beta hydrolase superfamily lysophospholipase
MKHEEYRWRTFDGINMHAQTWEPETAPRAVVAFVHGLGEHLGRYVHVAEKFTAAGMAFSAFDHRGHGKSGGPWIFTPSYEHFMRDLDRHIEETRVRFPSIPLVLYGHSMGGSITLYYVLRRIPKLSCVIASSPALGSGTPQPAVKMAFGRLMNSLIPTLRIPTGFPADGFSRDPSVNKAVAEDPLFHQGISVRLGLEVLAAGEWIRAQASFPLPLLVMQGTGDTFVDPKMNIDFAARIKGDVTLKTWNGCFHELHNEPEKEQVIAFMIDWVNGRVRKGAA